MKEDRAFIFLLQFAFYFFEMAFETNQAEREVINKPPEQENYLHIVTKRKTPLTCIVFLTC